MEEFQHKFSRRASAHHNRRLSQAVDQKGIFAPTLKTLFMGVSALKNDDGSFIVALAAHDQTYLVDFWEEHIQPDPADPTRDVVADCVIRHVLKYEQDNFSKLIGSGLPTHLTELSPTLCSRLWLEVDIIPIVIEPSVHVHHHSTIGRWDDKRVDEQADSMARKCIMYVSAPPSPFRSFPIGEEDDDDGDEEDACFGNFGPSMVPLLQVGWRGAVQVDGGFQARLNTAEDHKKTVGAATWKSLMHYTKDLKDKKLRIGFFSSTPQGGGVALMRHALVRLSKILDVDLNWYVPKPRPGVFRSTKNMHNILQGVADPDQRLSKEEMNTITQWIQDNAKRYWLSEGGPLRPPRRVDDPQMPGIIPMIKELTPDRPVLYRSHIQIRSDLVAKEGSPQAEVWDFLWNNIKLADSFISHPIPEFVPYNVPHEIVGYMPATTDWLDGLNKPMNDWDSGYYGNQYNVQCNAHQMTKLEYPRRDYIVQIARFDPAKGIPTVIDAYGEFRKRSFAAGIDFPPQLVVAGNSSVDDPDANMIYDQTLDQIEKKYAHLASDISVMRLDANDQLLNTLIAKAKVVLQLSTREGFEVKVSEALHAGRPVIATLAGGIPLQVHDGVDGYLVQPGDYMQVAEHLTDLFTDEELWRRMSQAARDLVSDEVGTPGNALAWYYLASKWAAIAAIKANGGRANALRPKHCWINDMAREEAGFPYEEGENKLPRKYTEEKVLAINGTK
ncbi:trehalose-phosphatase [Apiospora aurea]|uniref:Trehalose-phosphatase n=1 Tax=Apiospora aurea TaxID=335848 RepID=A0ABR1Q9H0_9PEZI